MRAIQTDGAPAAIGPYSQAVQAGSLLFISGQIPLDPTSGELVSDDIEQQTRRCLDSLTAILEAAGATLSHVTRATVFLTDLGDFQTVNAIYASYFGSPAPTRSTVQVAALPKGSRVEIDAIAVLPTAD